VVASRINGISFDHHSCVTRSSGDLFGDKLPQGDFRNYLTGLAGIWALISLLAILDPRFGEKLSAFKDLPSFLPFGGKPKEH